MNSFPFPELSGGQSLCRQASLGRADWQDSMGRTRQRKGVEVVLYDLLQARHHRPDMAVCRLRQRHGRDLTADQKRQLKGDWIIAKKRNLFDELMRGMDDLAKRTARATHAENNGSYPSSELVVTPGEITVAAREIGCSQPVFAAMLHTKPKTLKTGARAR